MGRFEDLLSDFPLAELRSTDDVIFGLWPDLRLAWFNDAWFRFAEANGGEPAVTRDWPVGRSLLDAVPGPLLAFYRDAYASLESGGPPWSHDYECSGPSVFRLFHQTVYPLGSDGFLSVNSLSRSGPPRHRAPGGRIDEAEYLHRGHGLRQCAHCRRFENALHERWDWIGSWVAEPPLDPHQSLCPPCFGHYYPSGAQR